MVVSSVKSGVRLDGEEAACTNLQILYSARKTQTGKMKRREAGACGLDLGKKKLIHPPKWKCADRH